MNKQIAKGVTITYLGMMALGLANPNTVFADTKSDLQAKQEQVAKINNNVESLVAKSASYKKQIDVKTQNIDKLSKSVEAKQKNYDQRFAEMKKSVKSLQDDVSTVTDDSSVGYILTHADSISDAINMVKIKKELMNAKIDNIEAVEKEKKSLEESKDKLDGEKAQLISLKDKNDDALATVKEEKSKAESAVKELQTKYKSELAQQAKEQKEADARAKAQIAKQQADAKAKQEAETKANETTATNTVASRSESTSTNSSATSSNSSATTSTATTTSATSAQTESASVSHSNSGLVGTAYNYIGVPYVWGGTTPSGFDCSGFTSYVLAQNGISVGRTSQAQSMAGSYVSLSQLQPGDLVFWGGVGSAYHVGIYIGGGQYIHAPQPGESVKVGSMQWFRPSFGRRL